MPRSCKAVPARDPADRRSASARTCWCGTAALRGFVIRLSAKGFGEAEVDRRRRDHGREPPCRTSAWPRVALEAGIGGFHFYHGIPGAIGGALRMNAGANGVETRERVVEVPRAGPQGQCACADQRRHGLRLSPLVRVEGTQSSRRRCSRVIWRTRDAIKAAMDAVQHHRETVQPIREKTGGSTFKNPPKAPRPEGDRYGGCRGLMIGGAQMSPMHCNFMINTGTATGYDLDISRRDRARAGAGELRHPA